MGMGMGQGTPVQGEDKRAWPTYGTVLPFGWLKVKVACWPGPGVLGPHIVGGGLWVPTSKFKLGKSTTCRSGELS